MSIFYKLNLIGTIIAELLLQQFDLGSIKWHDYFFGNSAACNYIKVK